jgi:hypothetical protein
LGTAFHRPVERLAIGGAQVDGGEHPQGAAGWACRKLLRAGWSRRRPLYLMRTQIKPIRSAEGISWIMACPTECSPLAFTSRVLSARGMSGRMVSAWPGKSTVGRISESSRAEGCSWSAVEMARGAWLWSRPTSWFTWASWNSGVDQLGQIYIWLHAKLR